MQIGPRLWKTGIAVTLTIFLVRLTGHHYEVYGAVAAALAVAPSAVRSLRAMGQQVSSHLIGSLVGTAAVLILGPSPVVIGGAVILVLWLLQRTGLREMAPMAATVALFVMTPHSDDAATYAAWRLLSVLMGSVVGTAVNALLLPPDYLAATRTALKAAGAALDQFILHVTDRLVHPQQLTKAEVLAGAATVEAQIGEARRLYLLWVESHRADQRPHREVLERALKVLSSLLERIQVIHKAALYAERGQQYGIQLPEIQAALARLAEQRRVLYDGLLEPGAGSGLLPVLAELERRFESSPGLPESDAEVEPFFRLYRMRSSVSYMANRLARLWVARENALGSNPSPEPQRPAV